MIVTKAWLNEWIELDGNTTDDICKSLNAIGLEVDAVNKLSIPEGVKVGFVKACEKHPDADKLNVCQVDLGDEEVQIVCGAKNVAQGQHVAVATIGTVLGDDFKIKKAKLRGVESSGMICSATEIGLPDINDGILELDESIGVLTLGKQLTEYTLLNDDIIEIELTANRGDCLSVYGVSRDLSASLGLEKKNPNSHFVEDPKGIANIFQFEIEGDIESGIEQKFFEVQKIVLPLLYQFRLACIDHKSTHILHDYLTYATQATGVLFRAYDFDKLVKSDDTVVS
ncbi:MAG: phenylalanine--tRNA ligase subunit beta, partial [Epsilonproteobacteria bacterium]|nr:phenylalanine--tRNA ligase subunit beta [Campylobacterota bacterium]